MTLKELNKFLSSYVESSNNRIIIYNNHDFITRLICYSTKVKKSEVDKLFHKSDNTTYFNVPDYIALILHKVDEDKRETAVNILLEFFNEYMKDSGTESKIAFSYIKEFYKILKEDSTEVFEDKLDDEIEALETKLEELQEEIRYLKYNPSKEYEKAKEHFNKLSELNKLNKV
jgi:hypothetical protein